MGSSAMMELAACALFVTVSSLVSATPYGYGGVKGGAGAGASATAVSSSVAGTFGERGDIPPGNAFGNGFSGSFSKSSSSSSSSSSASSSTSSTSFTYSGYRPGEFVNPALPGGNTGCTSGPCQNSGSNEIYGNQGAGYQGHNAANSVAGYGTTPGTDCQESSCNENSSKCPLGQCKPTPHRTSPSGQDLVGKCISGQCESPLQSGPSASQYDDSEDIRFVAHSKSLDSKDQSFKDTTVGSTTKYHGAINSYGDPIPSSNLLPTDFNSKPTVTPGHVLSIDLETPKLDSNCNSGNCNVGHTNPRQETLPISYTEPKPSCVKGKCDNEHKGNYYSTTSNSLSTNYLSPQGSYSTIEPFYANPGSSCTGSNCGGSTNIPSEGTGIKLPSCNSPNCYPHYESGSPTAPTTQPERNTYSEPNDKLKPQSSNLPVYTGGFGGPRGVLNPNEYGTSATGSYRPTQPTTTLANKPIHVSAPSGCNTPGCSNPNASPHYEVNLPTAPTAYPEQNTYSGPNDKLKPQSSNLPVYTGGFGGPGGVLNPNEYGTPTTGSYRPTQPTTTLTKKPIQVTAPSGCNTPGCSNPIASPHYEVNLPTAPTAHPAQNTYSGPNDKLKPQNSNLPVYTGGFGSPGGVLKPNEYDSPTAESYRPIQPSTTHNNKPVQVTEPTGCNTPSCLIASPHYEASLPTTPTTYPDQNTYPGPNDKFKPLNDKPPVYTDGFGGPGGVLKPNKYDTPATGSYRPTQPSTTLTNKPIQVTAPSGCNTLGCPNPVASPHYEANHPTAPTAHPAQNTYSGPNDKLKPHSSNLPVYTGGFGGPTGVLKPNEYETPATESYHPPQPSTTLNYKPIYETAPSGCNTPSCSNPVTSPHYETGFPTTSTARPEQNTYSGPNNNLEPPYVKPPNYTGGFSGPTGVLKPNEYDTPATGSYHPTQTSTALNYKPIQETAPSGCRSSGCSSPVSSTGIPPQSHYGSNKPSISEEKQPVYTGGFGGPPGILKPNEFDIPISSTTKPAYITNPTYNNPSPPVIGCTTFNCGSSSTIGSTSSTSHTGSYGTHIGSETVTAPNNNLPVYTGGFGGPPGMLNPEEFDIKVPIHSQEDIKVPIHSSHPSHDYPPTSPIAGCNTPNCNSNSPLGPPSYSGGFGGPPESLKPNVNPGSPTSLSGTTPQPTFDPSKPIALPPPSSITFPGHTNNYRPVGVNYPSAPAVAPIIPSYVKKQPQYPSTISFDKCKTGYCLGQSPIEVDAGSPSDSHDYHPGCKTGHCVDKPTSEPNTSIIPGSYDTIKPETAGKPTSPQNTGTFNKPSESVPSGVYTSNVPSGGSGGTVIVADSQSGSYAGSNLNLPAYTGGFGAPSGLFKPNDYSKPDISSVPSKSGTGTAAPVTCSTGKCNTHELSPSSIGYDTGLSGSHTIASNSASANSGVIYSGGFGGPPGFLTPYDNGKVDLTKIFDGKNQGLQYGSANTPNVGVTGPARPESNIGYLGGSAAGANAAARSIASANSGSYGYNTNGNHQAGSGIKGESPCVGGCGRGYRGPGSYAAAEAKSLSFGGGGNYAGSSASAYSSAGAYTKGGYGKR